MFIERVIFFIPLGFFVFSPQVPGWQEGQHFLNWYGYYLLGAIFLAIVAWALNSRKKPPRQ